MKIMMNEGAVEGGGGSSVAPVATPEGAVSAGEKGGSPAAIAPPASSPDKAVETFEVKVNGRMVKMSRQELIDNASMSYAASERFADAKKQRAEAERIIKSAKSNPIEALMDPALGLTKDQIRDAFEKWYNSEYIEPEALNEDQRKNRELEARLKKFEQQEAEKKEREEQEQLEALTNREREVLQAQIIEAIESSGLPKTKLNVARMAFYMRQNMQNGWDAPISMIVSQVRKEQQDLIGSQTKDLDAEGLIKLMGEDVIMKIRQHDLRQLQEKRSAKPVFDGGRKPEDLSGGTGKVSMDEVNERIKQMRSGKLSY